MSINADSLERVQIALDDIIAGCEVEDDYTEWEDVASSSVSSVLEELDSEQTDMTCAAFRRYVTNTIGSKALHQNKMYNTQKTLADSIV